FLLHVLFVFGEGMILGRRYRHRLHVLADTMIGSLTMGETFRRLGLPVETANDSQAILACVSKIAGDAVRYYGRAPDTMFDFLLTAYRRLTSTFVTSRGSRSCAHKACRSTAFSTKAD